MDIIPLFNIAKTNKKISKNILASWASILNKNSFTSGEETTKFEQKFAKICQAKYALAVNSGTSALIIALKAAGIKPGNEVITTPATFSATADSIVLIGAKPVFADVDIKTGNISPKEIIKKITKKTRAILLVHLYGVPAEMDEIMAIAKKHNIKVIEDASHAHGSLYKNKAVGSFGIAGCFSLYPSKTLGAMGNAGIITSNNKEFIQQARIYAHHGIKKTKYLHHSSGFNFLINNLQAATLLQKIPIFKKEIKKKIKTAQQYNDAFNKIGLSGMNWPKYMKPSLYIYAFQANKRNKMKNHFSKNFIDTGIYYPTPLHLQPSMKFLNHKKGDFPKAEKFFKQTLSIPIFGELTKLEINRIIKAISLIKK